ncbi:MAG TPA: zinc ribbon domain-containing protein [Candidatus Eisenbacteria bacterium]|nr:zinc ribbon domain-containing protein [Candidatus Eisenbacteria bacterium]
MATAPWAIDRRRAISSPPNPLDKSTVVSILPMLIDEVKQTITPGRFIIRPGSFEKPAILVVNQSSWFRDVDPEQPLIEITNSSIQVADSIVKDFCNGLIGCDMAGAMPGLFYVMGAKTVDVIKKEHQKELEVAQEKQKNWYKELITIADIDWARTGGNPISISNLSRMAAQDLGMKEKPWMRDYSTMEMVNCPACGNLVRPGFPVCANCKTIVDHALYAKMGLRQG